ncbi:hypothetical protein [Deinococcus aluminii]|uniref:Uncharacterized protein n=1 Tax=Deinococcus aluminii TaxID=1656885 RepID=A0ABP9XEZ5_9DEIO
MFVLGWSAYTAVAIGVFLYRKALPLAEGLWAYGRVRLFQHSQQLKELLVELCDGVLVALFWPLWLVLKVLAWWENRGRQ